MLRRPIETAGVPGQVGFSTYLISGFPTHLENRDKFAPMAESKNLLPLPTAIRLVFEMDQFFNQSKTGAISGTIYLHIGDNEFFPERNWTDMVGAFLRVWLSALIAVADGTQQREYAPFFNGPVEVFLSSHDKLAVELNFVHREVTKYFAITTTKELMQKAITVAEKFLDVCRKRGWADDDIEGVTALTGQASQMLGQLRAGA